MSADLRHDFVQTINRPLGRVTTQELVEVFTTQSNRGRTLIEADAVDLVGTEDHYSLDMQFVGQTHILRVELSRSDVSIDNIRSAFEKVYFDRFRVELENIEANVVNVNTSVIGRRTPSDLSRLIAPADRRSTIAEAQTGRRTLVTERGTQDVPVYWRDHLPLTAIIDGPAIIEQMDTTILLEPGDTARGDESGNILIEVGHGD